MTSSNLNKVTLFLRNLSTYRRIILYRPLLAYRTFKKMAQEDSSTIVVIVVTQKEITFCRNLCY